MRDRIKEIKAKGFDMTSRGSIDINENSTGYRPDLNFEKIRIGTKVLEDAILELGFMRKINPRLANKKNVLEAIANCDLKTMREISEFFFKTCGIYSRMLRYMAYMYRYDWFVTPSVLDETMSKEKILEPFYKCLNVLDKFGVKKKLGEIALKILKYGVYYGYKIETANGNIALQELPCNYCRSRFFKGDKPAVEFNMKFFDDCCRDTAQRMRILKMFPAEFSKGYMLYKQGKLLPDFAGDTGGWYLLDIEKTVKLNVNGEDYPMFISIIPHILDLDNAQELDRKRTAQRLVKIIIQKMPLDKNGDLIFDIDEAQQMHNNACNMIKKAINTDVLTTFADVEVASLADTNAANNQTDDLDRTAEQIYLDAGVSRMLFDASGNIAVTNSILNDAATMYNMIQQFESFLNELIERYNKPKKISFQVQILGTTIYNYQELAKLYKEQTQLGYSKMLPQIALGQTQSSILANAYFENDVLDLVNKFIPPLMSSTMNGDFLTNRNKGKTTSSDKGAGRNELPESEKSTKTLQNEESKQ